MEITFIWEVGLSKLLRLPRPLDHAPTPRRPPPRQAQFHYHHCHHLQHFVFGCIDCAIKATATIFWCGVVSYIIEPSPPPPPPSQILYAQTCIYSLIYNVQVVFLPAVVALKNKLVRFSSNDVVGRSTVEKLQESLFDWMLMINKYLVPFSCRGIHCDFQLSNWLMAPGH
jgi:hypothetical protein